MEVGSYLVVMILLKLLKEVDLIQVTKIVYISMITIILCICIYNYSAIILCIAALVKCHKSKRILFFIVTILSKLLEAIDNGVRVFDCGDIYTGVELLYGRLIEVHTGRGGKREDIKIHTKLVPDLDVIKRGGVNESYVRGVIQRSLNRLKSLYVDLVQLHWWEWSSSGVMDALSVLGSLQREGIVQNIGLTNFNAEQTKEILGGTGIRINSIQVMEMESVCGVVACLMRCKQHELHELMYIAALKIY